MRNRRRGERPSEGIQNSLVGDLAGEADVSRGEPPDACAHERLSPMRRGARDVGNASGDRPLQEITWLLIRMRQDQRAIEKRPQVDLQPTVATDIVKRAPDHRRHPLRRSPGKGAGERGQGVHDQFRRASRPGGQQHPFGLAGRPASHSGRNWHRLCTHAQCHTQGFCRLAILAVCHPDISLGAADDVTHMVSGKPQAVMVHTNVGTANTLNCLADAYRENVPILGNLIYAFNFNQKPRSPFILPVHPKTTLIPPKQKIRKIK